MLALVSVFVAVILSLLITRVATVALTLTGLSRESARFQARSALSGAGFTTTESEAVVNHPIRRRIVMFLMLVGSAGIVTVIGTVVLSFANADTSERGARLGVLVAGLLIVWLVARSGTVDRHLSRLIGRLLRQWTDLDARDYAALLHLSGEYAVIEIAIHAEDWVGGKTLNELRLRDEGIVVLGISRPGGRYVGVPQFDTEIRPGDTLLAYGRSNRLRELDRRRTGPDGDAAHERAVLEEQGLLAAQEASDQEST